MDFGKRDLKGSPSRDAFKHWHKQQMSQSFYATDIDLVLVKKWPGSSDRHFIVAIIDYKQEYDCVSFTEAVFYNACIKMEIPVYIVISDYDSNIDSFGPFEIQRYIWCDPDPDPPYCELIKIVKNGTEKDFWEWEFNLRNRRAMEVIHGQLFNDKD